MKRFLILILISLLFTAELSALPAFPGAEGHGSDTIGGRGGTVYIVNTLADSGAGSLREACETTGARYVTFSVSGNIRLVSRITIDDPYITIAGETSPGGICVSGDRTLVNTHDVIIRNMRFRIGSQGTFDPDSGRSLEIEGIGARPNECYNVIVDHCSMSWAADTVVTIGSDAYDITLSWSIITDGLYDAGHSESSHNYGLLLWGKFTSEIEVRKYSLHHNYFGHHNGRVPEINFRGHLDSVNNLAFDYFGGKSPKTQGDSSSGTSPTVNWIQTYTKPGSVSNPPEDHFESRHTSDGLTASEIVYMEGCLGVQRDAQTDPEWSVGTGFTAVILPTSWQSLTPVYPSLVTATEMSVSYASEILTTVGASKPLRDSHDTSVVNDWETDTSGYTADVTYPGDYPTFTTPIAPTDLNSNGIADTYEDSTLGGYPVSATDDYLANGYDNIEDYLHSLAGDPLPGTISWTGSGSISFTGSGSITWE